MSERSAVQNPMLKYAEEIGWEYVRPRMHWVSEAAIRASTSLAFSKRSLSG